MNAQLKQVTVGTSLATTEHNAAVRNALRNSLYPGAADDSVDMVLDYCRASGLDPMTKPVHIVPMSVATGEVDGYGNKKKATRDVVMPGIGLYRINASRTGQYAGVTEPEYGPTQELSFKREVWTGPQGSRKKSLQDAVLKYPEWCRITVEKIVDGQVRQFTAKELWLENYADKGDSGAPNSMWEKRPFAQLAKCAEAQALRKAFPEAVGSQPTAEEMEGKTLYTPEVAVTQVSDLMPREKATQAANEQAATAGATQASTKAAAPAPAPADVIEDAEFTDSSNIHGAEESEGVPPTWQVTDGAKKVIMSKAKSVGLDESAVLLKFGAITQDRLNEVLRELTKMAASQ